MNMDVWFEDISQELIDNEFVIEQEHDGMECNGSSEPMTDWDFQS